MILLSTVFACSPAGFPDPDVQPYILEEVSEFGEAYSPAIVDLDNDGWDEIIDWIPRNPHEERGHITIRTLEGQLVDQVNFIGRVSQPHFLDYDEDGIQEILVPYVYRDSLFVSFVSAQGNKLFSLFLTEGKPRRDGDDLFPWDPEIRTFFYEDVNNDHSKDLISVVHAGLAGLPRGVLIHSLTDRKLIGQKFLGAAMSTSYLMDVNNDGRSELIVGAGTSNNGTDYGGFDDRHSYIIAFDLENEPEVTWSRELGGLWTTVSMFRAGSDNKDELVAFTWSKTAQPEATRIIRFEPGTWKIIKQQLLIDPLKHPVSLDLNHDAQREIIAMKVPDELWVFNHELAVVEKRQYPFHIQGLNSLPDVDGDGVDEILLHTRQGAVMLNPSLDIKAGLPQGSSYSVMRRGLQYPYIVVLEQGQAIAYQLTENRFYLLKQYSSEALWVVGSICFIILGITVLSRRRNNQRFQQTLSIMGANDERGILQLGLDRRVTMLNPTIQLWTGCEPPLPVEQVFVNHPDILTALDELTELPAYKREKTITLQLSDRMRKVHITAQPLFEGKGHTGWIIYFDDRPSTEDIHRSTAWGLMAQRVAHDLRNPLNGIHTNLVNLQQIYQQRCPQESGELDEYADHIHERVELLMRSTSDFMKFVDLEAPKRALTDINILIMDYHEDVITSMPKDIHLLLQLDSDIPPISVDHDQFISLLRNLVVNAQNAMIRGGQITISTQLVRNLHLPQSGIESQDYAIIEVRDTGPGIPTEIQNRIFEPGFSTSKNGTGMGLAIIKKIIEDHEGCIDIQSEPENGASFLLYLPINQRQQG